MDLFNLGAKITLDTGDYESKIEVAKKAFEGLKTTVSGINKVGEATAEVVGTVSGAIASGVGAMAKQAIDAYANYEQLIGGVDTLFKNAASTVQENASNAFKTAGLSANEYMETVTSFSASLIQSLSSTTQKAVQIDLDALSASLDQQYELRKNSYEDQYDALKNHLGDELEARKNLYAEQQDALEESLNSEIEAYEKATDEKIKLINKEYAERLKLVDREEYERLAEIDNQIDALNALTEAEKAQAKLREQEEKKTNLQIKIDTAETAEEKAKAEKDYADYVAKLAQERVEAERKAQIEALKEQKTAIKEESKEKRAAIEEEQNSEIKAIKASSAATIAEMKKTKEEQLKTLKESNDQSLKELQRANEEELKLLKRSNEEKLKELQSYNKQRLALASAATVETSKQGEATAETYAMAAEKADLAITDMADNANKMGTAMEAIQNAYQGFAKQNYTMLDNLNTMGASAA